MFPRDIQKIIDEYIHNIKMIDIKKEIREKILKKQLNNNYNSKDIEKILESVKNIEYIPHVEYISLEPNLYSKILVLVIQDKNVSIQLEEYFSEQEIDYLGVGNYETNSIHGLFVYDALEIF